MEQTQPDAVYANNALKGILPNVSLIHIQVNTKFKPQIEEGEDFKTQTIKAFHNAVSYYIEKMLTEDEDLEQKIIEQMQDNGDLTEDTKEFSDLGEISIQIWEHEPVKIEQKDLDEEEVKFYLAKMKKPQLPITQKRLTGENFFPTEDIIAINQNQKTIG